MPNWLPNGRDPIELLSSKVKTMLKLFCATTIRNLLCTLTGLKSIMPIKRTLSISLICNSSPKRKKILADPGIRTRFAHLRPLLRPMTTTFGKRMLEKNSRRHIGKITSHQNLHPLANLTFPVKWKIYCPSLSDPPTFWCGWVPLLPPFFKQGEGMMVPSMKSGRQLNSRQNLTKLKTMMRVGFW